METDARTGHKGAPFTVIVAEKDPISRATLAAFLSCDGYRVFQAEDLKAAISCVNRSKDFEVLLADLDMPGWESLIQYTLKNLPDVFVIAMTGDAPSRDMPDLKECGIEATLQKPISYNGVEKMLSQTFGRRRAA